MKIPIVGSTVESIDSDYATNLVFSNGWEIRIEVAFRLELPPRVVFVGPGADVETRALASNVSAVGPVVEAECSEAGLLTLKFEGGTVLAVDSDDDYEAWTVAGPSGEKAVCQPGGGLAWWPASADHLP
jgi:hypothetical protein